MKHLITLIFFTLCFQAVAQLSIIKDPDGYTNVRADTSIQSEVLFRVLHGEVFQDIYDYPYHKNPTWRPIQMTLGHSAEHCYNSPEKSGYMHRSRVLPIQDIRTRLTRTISDNLITLENDSIQVRFSLVKVENQPQEACLLGTDSGYGIPNNKLSGLTVSVNDRPVTIPAAAIDYIYQIQQNTIKGYVYQDLILITSSTNAAAGYYECVWVISNGKYLKRYIYFGP